MRPLVLLMLSGCSLIYDGSDLKGKAAGRPKWTTLRTFTAGDYTTAVAVGDLDGDGKPDIVATNHGDSTLSVWGNLGGDANFAPRGTPPTCISPTAIVLADFNESGQTDAFVVCQDDGTGTPAARAYLSANGTLDLSKSVDVAGNRPMAVGAGDFDRDGHLDAVVAYETGVAIHIGAGDGSFVKQPVIDSGDGPLDLVVTDLDGDGAADIAVANNGSSSVGVLLMGPKSVITYPTHPGPWGIAAGDFDKKNGLDLAVATYDNGFFDLLLAQGGGTFPASLPPELIFPVSPSKVRVADFDQDGRLDVVVGAYAVSVVLLYYGKGDGSFEDPVEIDAPSASGVEVADFDGDGRPDIVISTEDSPGSITVLMNR